MAKHRIVIIGGGFGGIKTALELCDDNRFHVTLVSDRTDFRSYPALYRIVTGGAVRLGTMPLSQVFQGKSVRIITASLSGIDRKARIITLDNGGSLPFDGLVLAMGVRTNHFGIPGLDRYTYGIKTPEDAVALRQQLHQHMINERQLDHRYVVIGGGPTGIELAAALPEYLRRIAKQHGIAKSSVHVDLIEASPRLLPRMPRDVSMMVKRRLRKLGVRVYTKTTVQARTADTLVANNKPIRSHTVVWTAGVANHPFFAENGFQVAQNRKVRVDQFLQAEPGIYVIGDNADTPYSGLAQTAIYDAKFVANNYKRLADQDAPKPYRAVEPAYVIPAGPRWAALLWRGIRLYGWPAWVLRGLADLMEYRDYQPWRMAAKRWAAESVEEETCEFCQDLNSFDLRQANNKPLL